MPQLAAAKSGHLTEHFGVCTRQFNLPTRLTRIWEPKHTCGVFFLKPRTDDGREPKAEQLDALPIIAAGRFKSLPPPGAKCFRYCAHVSLRPKHRQLDRLHCIVDTCNLCVYLGSVCCAGELKFEAQDSPRQVGAAAGHHGASPDLHTPGNDRPLITIINNGRTHVCVCVCVVLQICRKKKDEKMTNKK